MTEGQLEQKTLNWLADVGYTSFNRKCRFQCVMGLLFYQWPYTITPLIFAFCSRNVGESVGENVGENLDIDS